MKNPLVEIHHKILYSFAFEMTGLTKSLGMISTVFGVSEHYVGENHSRTF